jgi:RNA polymerase sigma factor (sigma-70 family)
MAAHNARAVEQLRHLLGGDAAGLRDDELLARFANHRDEAAFAALVERHGRLVFGLCWRVLGCTHDAEDAFQATFLVLARKAPALGRPGSLAGWLYGVANRVARRMKTQRGKRSETERRVAPSAAAEPADLSLHELKTVLDEEIERLPATQRQPLLLCYLEGLTQDEAAAQLGWPRGTLKRRLEKARAILRGRLTRRGLTLAAALVSTLPASDGLAAAPPKGLPGTLARAAALFACKKPLPAALASAHIVTLAEGVLKTMLATKLKSLLVALTIIIVLSTGAVLFAQPRPAPVEGTAQPTDQVQVSKTDQPPREQPPREQAKKDQPPKDEQKKDQPRLRGDAAKLQGVWDIVEIEAMEMATKGEGATITFDGDGCVIRYGPGSHLKGKFKLDESQKPGWIDLAYYEVSSAAGQPALAAPTVGAYKFDGDALILALGVPAGSPEANGLPKAGRPVGFDTSPGTGAMVLRLVRRDPDKPREKGKAKEIPLGERWTGSYCTEHNQVRQVIGDDKTWAAVWAKSMGAKPETPVSPEPQQLVKVDFTKHMVLAAFMGDRENGGHEIDITRVVASADGWTVYVRQHSPPPGGTPKITQQPFVLVVVPRLEGKIVFVNEDIPDAPPRERKSSPLSKQTQEKLDEILKEVEGRAGEPLAGKAMTLDQARELARVGDGLVWQFEYRGWFVFAADFDGAPWFWMQAVFVKRGGDRVRYWKESW